MCSFKIVNLLQTNHIRLLDWLPLGRPTVVMRRSNEYIVMMSKMREHSTTFERKKVLLRLVTMRKGDAWQDYDPDIHVWSLVDDIFFENDFAKNDLENNYETEGVYFDARLRVDFRDRHRWPHRILHDPNPPDQDAGAAILRDTNVFGFGSFMQSQSGASIPLIPKMQTVHGTRPRRRVRFRDDGSKSKIILI